MARLIGNLSVAQIMNRAMSRIQTCVYPPFANEGFSRRVFAGLDDMKCEYDSAIMDREQPFAPDYELHSIWYPCLELNQEQNEHNLENCINECIQNTTRYWKGEAQHKSFSIIVRVFSDKNYDAAKICFQIFHDPKSQVEKSTCVTLYRTITKAQFRTYEQSKDEDAVGFMFRRVLDMAQTLVSERLDYKNILFIDKLVKPELDTSDPWNIKVAEFLIGEAYRFAIRYFPEVSVVFWCELDPVSCNEYYSYDCHSIKLGNGDKVKCVHDIYRKKDGKWVQCVNFKILKEKLRSQVLGKEYQS